MNVIKFSKSDAKCTVSAYLEKAKSDRHASNITLHLGLLAKQSTTEGLSNFAKEF